MSRQGGILNISESYRPPQPVKGIALLFDLMPSKVFHARFILITYTPQTLDIQHAVNSTA
jgi:hypothetical protein